MREERMQQTSDEWSKLAGEARIRRDVFNDHESLFREMRGIFEKRLQFLDETLKLLSSKEGQYFDKFEGVSDARQDYVQSLQQASLELARTYRRYLSDKSDVIENLRKQVVTARRAADDIWISVAQLGTLHWIEEKLRGSTLSEEAQSRILSQLEELIDEKIENVDPDVIKELSNAGIDILHDATTVLIKEKKGGEVRAVGFLR